MNRTARLTIVTASLILTVSLARAADPLELTQTIKLEGKAGNLDHLAVDVRGERLFARQRFAEVAP